MMLMMLMMMKNKRPKEQNTGNKHEVQDWMEALHALTTPQMVGDVAENMY